MDSAVKSALSELIGAEFTVILASFVDQVLAATETKLSFESLEQWLSEGRASVSLRTPIEAALADCLARFLDEMRQLVEALVNTVPVHSPEVLSALTTRCQTAMLAPGSLRFVAREAVTWPERLATAITSLGTDQQDLEPFYRLAETLERKAAFRSS